MGTWLLMFLLLAGLVGLIGWGCDCLDRALDRDHDWRDRGSL